MANKSFISTPCVGYSYDARWKVPQQLKGEGSNSPPTFRTMTMHSIKNHRFALVQRNRGRPPTTTDADRARNYQDANGNYSLGQLKPWHTRVVDYMIAHPAAKIKDIAEAFGVSKEWMGRLMKSDSFREYYERRMTDHQDLVSVEIVSKMQTVATKALEEVSKRIEHGEVSGEFLLDSADLALKGLGYTAPRQGVAVNVKNGDNTTTVVAVEASAVEKARAKLQQNMRLNSATMRNDPDNYTNVTASMEANAPEIEDAVVLRDDDSDV